MPLVQVNTLIWLLGFAVAGKLRGGQILTDAQIDVVQYPSHEKVFKMVTDSFNDRKKLTNLADLFDFGQNMSFRDYMNTNTTGVEYCDPYPHCLTSQAEIRHHLTKLSSKLSDVRLEPAPQTPTTRFWNRLSGGFWVLSLAYSVRPPSDGNGGGVTQLTSAFLTWELSDKSTSKRPLITSLRLHYDEESWLNQLSDCMSDSSGLMITTRNSGENNRPEQKRALVEIANTLLTTVSTLNPRLNCPKSTYGGADVGYRCEWVDAFVDPFDHTPTARFCEEVIHNSDKGNCLYGRAAVRKFENPSYLYGLKLTSSSPVMVAGEIATVLTVWASLDEKGKISTHRQVMQFGLTSSIALDDAGKLNYLRIYISSEGIAKVRARYEARDSALAATKETSQGNQQKTDSYSAATVTASALPAKPAN